MKALVFGAGKQGRVAGAWLVSNGVEVTYADVDRFNLDLAERLTPECSPSIYVPSYNSTEDLVYLTDMLRPFDVVFSSAVYYVNLPLTIAAIEAKTHLVDLGGNVDIVDLQFNLFDRAEKAGVAIIPDCGLAPGMSGLLAAASIEQLGGEADEVKVRVGGLPLNPVPPLNYMIVFSVQGLINEYLEDAKVLRDGKIEMVPSLADVEELWLHGRTYEAFNTSGGISTLPHTYEGKVKNMDYKTIRYPGHANAILAMKQIGLFSEDLTGSINPRNFTARMMEEHLKSDGQDKVLVYTKVIKGSRRIEYTLYEEYDSMTGHSAMGRTTSYSAAIIAKMLGEGKIKPGVWEQEKVVPLEDYIKDLKDSGLNITKKVYMI